jgi:hypothetical protein
MKEIFNTLKPDTRPYVDREFITTPDALFLELVESKLHGNVIGISSPLLGAGIFMTAVEDILLEGKKTIIILKRYDINGHFLSTNKLPLEKIAAVCPFKSKFSNPFLSRITGERNTGRDEAPTALDGEVSLT